MKKITKKQSMDETGNRAIKVLKRQPCEIYSRIVGYIRPVQNWHVGKKEEFKDRRTYDKILYPSSV